MTTRPIFEFDTAALFRALDARRIEEQLSWAGVAREIWAQSAALNAQRHDHPISPATLTGILKRRDTTCQHALFICRWLGRPPETFLRGGGPPAPTSSLPAAGPEHRLRWDLASLAAAIDVQRRLRQLTWPHLATILRCSPSQLSGLRTVRYAIGMVLAMRLVQWLERPASDFIYPATW